MRTVRVNLAERSYEIKIAAGLLKRLGKELISDLGQAEVALVTDSNVASLYLKTAEESLIEAGFAPGVAVVPAGEEQKSLKWVSKLYDQFFEMELERGSLVLALGGGMIGDLAGFAAATFMRGVPFVQVPTTLLAQVDSSVGGKVAVNHKYGKNMIGAFYQPRAVYIDPETLRSLPEEELRSGLAEVVKYGIILDAEFFGFLEENVAKILALDIDVILEIIGRCCRLKAQVVEEDEREAGLRAILNYGHTTAHALESLLEYKGIRHGQAVAVGMVVASEVAERMGLIEKEITRRQEHLLERLGLPIKMNAKVDEVLSLTFHDKKVKGGRLRFVLPRRIGEVIISDEVSAEILREALGERLGG